MGSPAIEQISRGSRAGDWSLYVPPRAWSADPWEEAGAPARPANRQRDILIQTIYTLIYIWRRSYLESSSQTEDAVVCLLLGETLERLQDRLVFFGNQVIGSARAQSSKSVMSRVWKPMARISRAMLSSSGAGNNGHTSSRASCTQRHCSTNWTAGS
jgi:hypothetical protein